MQRPRRHGGQPKGLMEAGLVERGERKGGKKKQMRAPHTSIRIHIIPHMIHTIAKIGDQSFARLVYLVPRCTPPQAVCPRSACWGAAGPT